MADALSYFLNRAKKLMRNPGTQKASNDAKACLDVLTLESRIVPTGNYSGVVFQDYNGNGVRNTTNTVANTSKVGTTNLAVDRGLGGVVVTAYDASGTARGSATSKTDGTYTLASTGTGPYRIEFATASFPTNFTVGPIGPDNGSNVQFLPDGGSATVSLGLFTGSDYLRDNPTLVAGRLVFGDPAGANKNTPALVTFPYNSGANGATNTDYDNPVATTLVTVDKVGSIYGLAQNPETGTLYASAYTKKHSGWGPGGPGQIYAVNQTTGVVTNFVNLDTIFGAGTTGGTALATARGAIGYDYDRDSGDTGWDAVGKSGFGGSALSPDGSTLYVINLADRNIYAIPTSGPLTNVTIKRQLIPLNAPGATGVAGADLRPFAVTFYRGQLYVGITNTAETTGARADLHSYVYTVNPTTLAFSAAPVFTVADLTFTRGFAANGFGGNPGGDWQAWRPTFATKGTNSGAYPQPMLSSIVFDADGNLTLGFRDRAGDQFGFFTLDKPGDPTRFEGVAAGDNLFAAITTPNNLASGWTLESNGSAGSFTGFGPGNNQGPGNGEFFFDTFGTFHQEIATGAAIQLPGYPDVLSTGFDTGLDVRAGGLMWLGVDGPAATVGRKLKGYNLYQTGFPGNFPQNTPNFGKANGLTNLTVVAEPAPIEIGNYVWKDANGNGIQDANEAVVSGLSVELWDLGADGKAGGGDDTKLGTAITNAAGQYYFSGFNNVAGQAYYVGGLNILPNHNYQVRVPNATSKAAGLQQASVTGLNPTFPFNDGTTDGVIRDSNAIVAADGTTGLINITTGVRGANSHNYDVGFATLLPFLGNEVWEDVNNNGQYDAGTDKLLQNITVNLLDSTGTFVKSTVTDISGKYLFSSITPGTYRVEVVTPAGYTSSTGNGSSKLLSANGAYEPGTALDTQNQFDHGTNTAGVGSNIRTAVVQVFAYGNAGNPDVDSLGNAGAGNLRQDFGLVRTFSLGNRVWLDANNDGLLNNGEAGIGSVTVRLLDAAGVAIVDGLGNAVTVLTDANGYYRFDNLVPGTYRVEVANSGVITTLRSSTGLVGIAGVNGPFEGAATPSPDTDIDSDDNGTLVGGNYRSGVVTLGPSNVEPINEADLGPGGQDTVDAQANLTVDFGFFRPMSLGNRLWIDANNNGKFDTGEANAPAGVLVNLLNSAGTPVLDAANAPITTLTNATGNYLFTGLNPGQYKVGIDKANFLAGGKLLGFTSSTGGGNGSTTGPNEPIAVLAGDNADSGTINGTLTAGGVIAATVTLVNGTATVNETGGNTTPGIVDATADNDSELTVDFGFIPVLSLGNRVWNDLNNNGKFDAGEPALNGLTVRLLDSTGNPVLNGVGVAITTITNATGNYLFTNLTAGKYIVEVVPPSGFVSSTGVQGSTNGAFEPGVGVGGTSDDSDHGTSVGSFFAPTGIRSGVIDLQPGTATTGEPVTPGIADPALDANSETTVDFGLFRPLSLGNRVWLDANNNGSFDAGELPGAGVTVQLLNGAGVAIVDKAGASITTVTSAKGWYLFTGLGEGTYKVAVAAGNFNVGGPLAGFGSSTGVGNAFEPPVGLPGNNKDSGSTVGSLGSGGFVTSNLITLTVGGEATNEEGANGLTPGIVDPARDQDSLVSIDFGFFQTMSLGNRLWVDSNNNGMFDTGEAAVAGAQVNLLDTAGAAILDGVGKAITTVTNAQGYYLFTGLSPAQYRVGIDKSNFLAAGKLQGYVSSTGSGNGFGATGPNEPAAALQGDDKDSGTTNGTLATGGVISPIINLANGGATTGEPATPGFSDPTADANSELTVDFGFVPVLSLGNRVWNDLNNNGKFDAGEPAISGLTVRLLDSAGNPVLDGSSNPITRVTDVNGYYLFTNILAGSYIVEVVPPAGFVSSTGVQGSTNGAFEPGVGVGGTSDDSDHGTSVGSFFTPTGIRSGVIDLQPGTATTGEPVTPGIADPALDANSETTVDFGLFRPLSLGNLVWNDLNNNGVVDAGEPGIAGVTVSLFADVNGDGVPDGPALTTTTTNAQGSYLFTNLGEGQYVVEITPPAKFISSSGKNGSATGPFEVAPSPNTGTDNDDNGTSVGATIRSGTVIMTVGGAPIGEPATPGITDGTPDQNANYTVDFGVYRPLSLGNLVWNDLNNNGVLDAGETGVANVVVNLLTTTGTVIATTTTGPDGSYNFSNLTPGDYVVQITPPAGYISSTGGTNGSGPYEVAPGPNNDVDNDDNGTLTGTVIVSSPVTLTIGGEPANGGDTNPTVDFGILQPMTIGNLVFNDANNNGKADTGEVGIAGIRVRIYRDDNKDGIPDGAALGTVTTNANGSYLFTGLGQGGYIIEVDGTTVPAGLVTSSGKNGSATGAFEPAPSPGNNVDGDDNGSKSGTNFRSGPVMLMLGTNPTGEPATPGITDGTPDNNSNTTVDFGFYQPLSFGNTVWRDDNNNGKFDPGEVVYPNIPVRIFDSTGALVASTTTGADGMYRFDLLSPGTYTVEITPPAGVLPSTPVFDPLTSGGDNLNIGKLAGTVIRSQPITLAVGKAPLVGGNTNTNNYVTGDFGLLALAMVSGYVYRDPDLNGIYTPGINDTPIGGVTIVLTGTDAGGQPITPRTMTTDGKGFYKFTDLPPGTYNIRELPPNGFLIKGADNVGSLGGTNPSVANLTVTLNANDNGLLYNFGHYTPSALFGNVYVDANGNCVRDIGEPGIAGVPIVISGTAFAGLTTARPLTAADVPGGLTVFTNGEGRYEFPVLPPGNYSVVEQTQPAAYADGCEQNGDPSAPAPTITNDNFSGVSLNPAQTRGPFNFGEIVLDPTKRQFLSSTPGGSGLPVSTNAPRADVQLNPSFTTTTGTPNKPAFVVTAAGAGTSPLVRVFDYATGGEVLRFLAYENAFTGGVRVATGDVNGDGTPDIITGIGVGGGPRVRVFSGKDGSVLKDFFAYEPTFTGGLFVASGDVNGDGKADIITGVEVGGGPRVQVFDGVTLQPILNFFAFDSGQRGGVRVASGDFDGDGRADIVTTTGVGVATLVRVYSSTGGLIREFAPYNSSFTGGVSLAVGDFNGDGFPDIVTGAEAGGGPHVQIFDGKTTTSIASFFAYDSTFTGGVRVSTRDVNGDGKADIITAPASASPSRIRVVNAATLQDLDTFFAFDPDYLGGAYVG